MRSQSLLLGAALFLNTALFSAENSYFKKRSPQNECCQIQGEPLQCYDPAFNAPAAIDVEHKDCFNIKTFLDGSFTYWCAREDGLTIASKGVLNTGVLFFNPNTTIFHQSFHYKPGFKLGVGIVGYHEWELHAEYTWFRGKSSRSSNLVPRIVPTAATAAAVNGTEVWVVEDWFLQKSPSAQALSGLNVSSSCHIYLDLIDFTVGRPFYEGRSFILSPFAGLRVAWIRQAMKVELIESSTLFLASTPPQPIKSHNHSKSWAVGPRVGLDAQILLPEGFRIEGDFAASLLYTKYSAIKHSEDRASTAFNSAPLTAALKNYSRLRPEAELGLGVGWGTYFQCNRFHLDFLFNYDFIIFWSQNMMRKLLDDISAGTGASPSDLYFHGLTITGRFDF